MNITAKQWQTILGTIGVICALVLAQTDVPLDPAIKLAFVIVAGVVAYLRPKGNGE